MELFKLRKNLLTLKFCIRNIVLWTALGLLGSCSVPDLADPKVLEEAKMEAIPLETLERKLMYGMLQLYVDQEEIPYTGWIRQNDANQSQYTMGYLKKGRREARWISWDENGTKRTEIEWKEDRMEGTFRVWHGNGRNKVTGQTTDGEVDGKWLEYYSTGKVACRSLNQTGHLIEIEVWRPDGSLCPDSRVINGNGSFLRYFENGKIEHLRVFKDGIETSRKIFD